MKITLFRFRNQRVPRELSCLRCLVHFKLLLNLVCSPPFYFHSLLLQLLIPPWASPPRVRLRLAPLRPLRIHLTLLLLTRNLLRSFFSFRQFLSGLYQKFPAPWKSSCTAWGAHLKDHHHLCGRPPPLLLYFLSSWSKTKSGYSSS